MTIAPLDDRVLVRPVEAEEKTASGIILPDTAKEKPQQGIVVAVGTDEELQKVLSAGDEVLFTKYGGSEIKLDGVAHVILQRSDVLGKIVR
ncbi:MAG: co-chaperone GroES [Thermaerobacter sp.]|nr:co-chaperone GroES [Thermaerobacter sp.]